MTRSQEIEMYRNVSTSPTLIRVRLKGSGAAPSRHAIVENTDIAEFLAAERGVAKHEYVDFMLKNATSLTVDADSLVAFLARRFGSKAAAEKYLRANTYSTTLDLEDLGLQRREDLIEKYFSFDPRTRVGTLKPHTSEANDPRFIALLIDQGLVVRRGDLVPVLSIYLPPDTEH